MKFCDLRCTSHLRKKSYTVFLSDLMKMDVLVTKTTKKKKYLKSLTWFLSLIICTVQYLGNMSEDWEWFHDLALLWLACVDFFGADFRNADSSAALQEGPPFPNKTAGLLSFGTEKSERGRVVIKSHFAFWFSRYKMLIFPLWSKIHCTSVTYDKSGCALGWSDLALLWFSKLDTFLPIRYIFLVQF